MAAHKESENKKIVPKNKSKCNYCGSEIPLDAKVCSSCFHYRHSTLNWIKHIASVTALIMVFVAVAQLIMVWGEKIDTNQILEDVKKQKEQADIVFKDVERLKSRADVVFQDVQEQEKVLNKRLTSVSNNITTLDNAFHVSKIQLEEKQAELKRDIENTKKDTEKEMIKVFDSVKIQAADSRERLRMVESEFNEKHI